MIPVECGLEDRRYFTHKWICKYTKKFALLSNIRKDFAERHTFIDECGYYTGIRRRMSDIKNTLFRLNGIKTENKTFVKCRKVNVISTMFNRVLTFALLLS